MADKLREASIQLEKWTKRRNDLIRKMRADGASLREIAEAAQMSHAGIAKILRG